MRGWRATAIIALTIPLSLAIALLALQLLGLLQREGVLPALRGAAPSAVAVGDERDRPRYGGRRGDHADGSNHDQHAGPRHSYAEGGCHIVSEAQRFQIAALATGLPGRTSIVSSLRSTM